MRFTGSDKTAALWSLACILPLLAGGCGGEKTSSNSLSRNSGSNLASTQDASGNDDAMDLGDRFIEEQGASSRTTSRGNGRDSQTRPAAVQTPRKRFYAIVLKTFNGEGHRMAAETMVQELPRVAPDLGRRARVHTKDTGSMVIVGEYETRDEADAQNELQRIRAMQINGTPLFARVMLVPITPEIPVGAMKPYDLRQVRKQYPNVSLIYTIDVAVWLDPAEWDEQGAGENVDIQREAERYCASLRAQGHEAYFYHDPVRGLSTVTVGVFGSGAIVDPSVGILRSDVEGIRDQFTPRLVNGEPLYQARDIVQFSRNPDADSLVAQKPQLVEVPR